MNMKKIKLVGFLLLIVLFTLSMTACDNNNNKQLSEVNDGELKVKLANLSELKNEINQSSNDTNLQSTIMRYENFNIKVDLIRDGNVIHSNNKNIPMTSGETPEIAIDFGRIGAGKWIIKAEITADYSHDGTTLDNPPVTIAKSKDTVTVSVGENTMKNINLQTEPGYFSLTIELPQDASKIKMKLNDINDNKIDEEEIILNGEDNVIFNNDNLIGNKNEMLDNDEAIKSNHYTFDIVIKDSNDITIYEWNNFSLMILPGIIQTSTLNNLSGDLDPWTPNIFDNNQDFTWNDIGPQPPQNITTTNNSESIDISWDKVDNYTYTILRKNLHLDDAAWTQIANNLTINNENITKNNEGNRYIYRDNNIEENGLYKYSVIAINSNDKSSDYSNAVIETGVSAEYISSDESIQSILDNSSNGFTIYLEDGPYNEDLTINNDDLELISLSNTILNGGIRVNSNNVLIKGLTIKNSYEDSSIPSNVGLYISGQADVYNCIFDSIADTNATGIMTETNIGQVNIVNSKFENIFRGIYLNPGDGNIIDSNIFKSCEYALSTDGQSNITILNNIFLDPSEEIIGASNVGNNFKFVNNRISNKNNAIFNYVSGNMIDAINNWWGTDKIYEIESMISDINNVKYTPFYTDDLLSQKAYVKFTFDKEDDVNNWEPDRAEPNAFTTTDLNGESVLLHSINAEDVPDQEFYQYQGMKYYAHGANQISIDLYLPSKAKWINGNNLRCSIWGTGYNEGDISLYPIIEFTNNDLDSDSDTEGDPRFRIFPIDPSEVSWKNIYSLTSDDFGRWYTFRIILHKNVNEIEYIIENSSGEIISDRLGANNTQSLNNIILQGHNIMPDGETYNIYWDNLLVQ